MSEAQTRSMTDEILTLFRAELRGWSLLRPLSIKQENEVLGRVRWGYDDMARILAPLMESPRALRESHAELLAALREIGSVCNCGLYDTKANRTHMKWCSVVVAKAAIAKAEASNGDS